MAASKLVLLSVLVALISTNFVYNSADDVLIDGGDESVEVIGSGASDSSALKLELEQFRSRIQALESQVYEKIKELKSKNEIVTQKEKIIQQKSETITSLQSDLASMEKKGSLDVQEQVRKAYILAGDLEKQVKDINKELEIQQREKEALEAQTNAAEKKINNLSSKLENLQKINDEQKTRLRKTEFALKIAEEEMMKAKLEGTLRTEELREVHGAWLPHWFAVHLMQCQSIVETHWNEHGKPAMDIVIHKALEKKIHAEKWAEPHVGTFKTKWVPAIKEWWLKVITYLEPHVQSLSTKSGEAFEASKSAVTPHLIRALEVADPYFQDAKTFSKSYIDQVSTMAKPHVEKVRISLKPYTKKVVHVYGRFLESASVYHSQVQDNVRETLKKHELTKPLATKEFEWFAASALLAIPVIVLSRICSAIFCKKVKKPVRNAPTNHHSRRKAKRSHSDK